MSDEKALRHELNKLQGRLAWLAREVARVEGQRDQLQNQLLDVAGADSSRYVAAR